jgi:hypothetical protein
MDEKRNGREQSLHDSSDCIAWLLFRKKARRSRLERSMLICPGRRTSSRGAAQVRVLGCSLHGYSCPFLPQGSFASLGLLRCLIAHTLSWWNPDEKVSRSRFIVAHGNGHLFPRTNASNPNTHSAVSLGWPGTSCTFRLLGSPAGRLL